MMTKAECIIGCEVKMTIEALLYEQGKISKEEADAIYEVNGKHCLRLFRGTSKKLTELYICGGYLDHHDVMDSTIDRKIAKCFAKRTPDPIILEIYVPVNEINFEGFETEKVHSKIFTRSFGLYEKNYPAFLQVPLKWIKNYYDVKTNKIIENSNFDPTFVPDKMFHRDSVIDEEGRYLMSKYAIKLPKSGYYTIKLSESKYVVKFPKSNYAQKKLKGLKTHFKG